LYLYPSQKLVQPNPRDVQESDRARGHCKCVQNLKMWREKEALKGDNSELCSNRVERRWHLTSLSKRNGKVTFVRKVT
jgi:hypothetical protein